MEKNHNPTTAASPPNNAAAMVAPVLVGPALAWTLVVATWVSPFWSVVVDVLGIAVVMADEEVEVEVEVLVWMVAGGEERVSVVDDAGDKLEFRVVLETEEMIWVLVEIGMVAGITKVMLVLVLVLVSD